MKTRITELFGTKYPIMLSGMSWISVPKMVAAVSEAGGLGVLATGPMDAEQTRAAIKEIRTYTKKPFGANATLLFPGAAQNAGPHHARQRQTGPLPGLLLLGGNCLPPTGSERASGTARGRRVSEQGTQQQGERE